ncbi:MAG: hypothetical protein WBH00_12190 [Xanthobacteraceae bacterium]
MIAKTESALRARAKRNGYRMLKSRRSVGIDNLGDFMLTDEEGRVVRGGRFDADLEEIANFLS